MPGVHYEEQDKENESDTSDTEDETEDGIDENVVHEILQTNYKDKQVLDDKSLDRLEVISEFYKDNIMDDLSDSSHQEQEIPHPAAEQNIIEDEIVSKTKSGREIKPIDRLNLFQQE
jgi:Holliday junction resolvasome RuvABC ATP-dependent DNA helicase subunit